MKQLWFSYVLTVVLLCIFGIAVLWFYHPSFSQMKHILVSPLPSFLTLKENQEVKTLDLWIPFFEELTESIYNNPPSVTARSVLMYELSEDRVVFEKKSKERMPMASLTKIMTAIIALENKKPDNAYFVYDTALVGENSMGLTAGEILTLEELLYGLILHSGNDAAEVLARNYPQGREAFIAAMNKKAIALGLKDTNFTNPSGLQGDGEQYTTAYDLLVITRYALDNFPLFRKVVATVDYTILSTKTHKSYYLTNETNLLTSYPGVKGVKTGYTPEAGLCLVSYLEYKDKKIIGILLGSENRRQEMKDLLDYSLISLQINPPKHN